MPQNSIGDKSTLRQIGTWCHHARSLYLNQCWPRSPTPYGVAKPQWVKDEIERIPAQRQKHDDVIKWKHFPRYWPFEQGIHRSPVNSPHKGQWRGALMFTLICARINGWVNNREAGDLRRHRAYYDVIVMKLARCVTMPPSNPCCGCVFFLACIIKLKVIVRRAGLLWSQQDFEWLWSVPLSSASPY